MSKHSRFKVHPNGDTYWYNEKGQIHREDGPAVIRFNGDKEWWINGKNHRLDGPAIDYICGFKEWYINGELHREDGPAVLYQDGNKCWYYQDNFISVASQEEFKQWLKYKSFL